MRTKTLKANSSQITYVKVGGNKAFTFTVSSGKIIISDINPEYSLAVYKGNF